MHAWRIGMATIAAVLGGCATPPVDLTRTFNEDDFRWAGVPGTATLTGQAFARTNGGDVRACAGLEIYLVPVTPYNMPVDSNLIIDRLGGTVETAKLCEVGPSAVSQWREKGIPRARLLFLRAIRPEIFTDGHPEPASGSAQTMAEEGAA